MPTVLSLSPVTTGASWWLPPIPPTLSRFLPYPRLWQMPTMTLPVNGEASLSLLPPTYLTLLPRPRANSSWMSQMVSPLALTSRLAMFLSVMATMSSSLKMEVLLTTREAALCRLPLWVTTVSMVPDTMAGLPILVAHHGKCTIHRPEDGMPSISRRLIIYVYHITCRPTAMASFSMITISTQWWPHRLMALHIVPNLPIPSPIISWVAVLWKKQCKIINSSPAINLFLHSGLWDISPRATAITTPMKPRMWSAVSRMSRNCPSMVSSSICTGRDPLLPVWETSNGTPRTSPIPRRCLPISKPKMSTLYVSPNHSLPAMPLLIITISKIMDT